MSVEIRNLQEKANKLMTDAHALLMKEGRTAEDRASASQMLADARSIEADITDLRSIEAFKTAFEKSPRPAVAGDVTPEQRKAKLSEAFRQYARHGKNEMAAEYRDLLTTGSAGNLIPQDFLPVLFEAQKYYGPIATMVSQKATDNNGVPIKVSLANDTTNGLTLIGEATAVVETDPSFQSRILGVDMVHGGLVKVSYQELEDSAFSLDAWLRTAFGKRYGRGIEAAITTGKDSAGTTLPNQVSGGLLSVAVVGTTTAALANGIGWSDLTAAYGALDPAYLINPKWVMSSTTRSYLIGLKDGFGRPYFENDPSNSAPFTKIMGYDIVLNQSMPAMGANATPILFGDLEQSLLFRTDGAPQLLRLNERYADTLEVGFFLYNRIGSISLDAGVHPLVSIKQASS